MEESAWTDFLGYTATIFGGLFGMLVGFILMLLFIGLMVWPAYAKWKTEKQERNQRRSHQNRTKTSRV